jgi:protein disulfide-isomerase A1
MKTILLGFILFELYLANQEDYVIELDESNFDKELEKHEHLLIEFYAPWCGHCKELAPEYTKTAAILKNDNPPLYLARVDATKNKELAKRFKLEGYPTVTLYTKGSDYVEYEGERHAKNIITWYRRKVNPISTQLDNSKEVESFVEVHKMAVVFFGNQSDAYQEYLKTAKELDEIHFGHCLNEECYSKYEIRSPEIILFKNFDDRITRLTDIGNSDDIKKFIKENSKPIVSSFHEEMAEYIFSGNKIALFYLNQHTDPKSHNIINSVAKKYKDKIVFIESDIKGDWESQLAAFLGVTEKDLPTVRLLNATNEAPTYIFKDELTEENLHKFIDLFFEGKLERYFKSEPKPEKQDGPVFQLVGDTFKIEVFESKKNVLVEFYAPWCEQCKKLEPRYKKIAEAYKDITDLIIAKIDATANDIEGINIEAFPSFKLFLVGEQKGIDLIDPPGTETITRLLNENLNLNVQVELDKEEHREMNPQQYHYDL